MSPPPAPVGSVYKKTVPSVEMSITKEREQFWQQQGRDDLKSQRTEPAKMDSGNTVKLFFFRLSDFSIIIPFSLIPFLRHSLLQNLFIFRLLSGFFFERIFLCFRMEVKGRRCRFLRSRHVCRRRPRPPNRPSRIMWTLSVKSGSKHRKSRRSRRSDRSRRSWRLARRHSTAPAAPSKKCRLLLLESENPRQCPEKYPYLEGKTCRPTSDQIEK